MTADDIIKELNLAPHPEGGWFKETYRHVNPDGGRGTSTAIFYLLKVSEKSHWHRVVDADEVWHWYAGCPLILRSSVDGVSEKTHILGADFAQGQLPQAVIEANVWQAAEPVANRTEDDDWVLVGCTVAPAFDFAKFEMAPPDWKPGQ